MKTSALVMRAALPALLSAVLALGGCQALAGISVIDSETAGADAAPDATVQDSGGIEASPVDAPTAEAETATSDAGCPSPYYKAVLAAHPVAFFRFAESTPAPDMACANEVAASPITCLYSSVTEMSLGVAGITACDSAVHLNATSAAIELSGGMDFPGDTPFTLEAWVKLDVGDAGYPYVTDLAGAFEGNPPSGEGYFVYYGRVGVRSETWNGNHITMYAQSSETTIADQYFYLVLAHSSVDHLDHLYVNAASTTDELVVQPDGGARPATGEPLTWQGFAGALADVAVYDYALTQADVIAHYQARFP